MKKLGIFIMAYEAVETLITAYERIPENLRREAAEIYVIDDASPDETYSAGLEYRNKHQIQNLNIYRNPQNLGYGGNQKKGLTHALSKEYDIVVVLHGDVQYAPEKIPELIAPIEKGEADMVFGSRMSGDPLGGGMPFYKFAANKFLTGLENLVLGLNLSEYHSGFRAYSCEALEKIPFHLCTDDFHFDTEILIQFKQRDLRIREITVPTHYGPESHQTDFWTSVRYGCGILRSLAEYRLQIRGLTPFPSKKFKNH